MSAENATPSVPAGASKAALSSYDPVPAISLS
jgi:hypothetical protein